MRAVAVPAGEAGSAALVELPQPTARADEVLVRVLEVGIDGTDRDIDAAVYGEPPPGEAQLVLGHEALGLVEAVGAEVQDLSVGDLVVPTVRRPCPERCRLCETGQFDFCTTGNYTERGIKGQHGFLAEFFTERSEHLVPIPEASRDHAVLLEPLSVVVKAVQQVFQVQERLSWEPRRALVLGAGPIGLLATDLLRLRGLEVFTGARTPGPTPQAALAEASGPVYLSTHTQPITSLHDHLGNLDIIFEATGSNTVAFEASGVLGTNGVLCLTGVSAGNRKLEVPADALNLGMVLGNKLAFGSVSSNRSHFQAALRSIDTCEATWPGLLGRIITRRLPLDGFAAALREEPGIKTLVEVAP